MTASTGELPDGGMPYAGLQEEPKVLYVMGAGHSGSTILGVTLGNCEGFFYAGELEEWTLRSGEPRFGGAERARFWRRVRNEVPGAEDLYGREVRDLLERSSAVLRPDAVMARRRLGPRYREVTESVYRAVARTAGASHVVDTSHFPLRARELQAIDGIDLYIVFLVREPQSVIGSYTHHINRHAVLERATRVLTKNIDLWLTHAIALRVFERQPPERRLFLRHEDFIADPEGVLRRILEMVGSPAAIPDLSQLRTGLPLQGNRLLWSDVVALKSKPVPPAQGSRVTGWLQRPWQAVLGRLQPSASAGAHRP